MLTPPRSFGYRLTSITGPLALLVDHVVGKWILRPRRPAAPKITWRWDIHPKSPLTSSALPLFGRMWKGYARQVLRRLLSVADALKRLSHVSTFWPARRDRRVHSDFLAGGRTGQPAEQSRRNPDGTGLGVFDAQGRPQIHKQPIAAWQDAKFATEAHRMTGTTFIAHVRYATTGSLDVHNTHPFLQDGRIFAHNGVVEGLDVLDARLREVGTDDLVLGQTDSERVFALITASIRARRRATSHRRSGRRHDLAGRERADLCGQRAAQHRHRHVGAALPGDPSSSTFWTGPTASADPEFDYAHQANSRTVGQLCARSSVVFATEPMDDDPRWALLAPGELVHVDAGLRINRNLVLPDPPRHLLRREELSAPVRDAQHALPTTRRLA